MATDVQYRGTPVFFAGKTWIVPSLSVAQFQDNYEHLTQPVEGEGIEGVKKRFATYLPLIALGLRRNYPEVTVEKLRDELDLNTFKLCLRAIQNASGLQESGPGEA